MFLVLSHERDRPLRYRLAARLDTMPSSPSSAAALKNLAPSPSRWSLNWIGRAGIRLDQPPEERPPFHEGLPPQILAIEVQEIEGKEHEPVRRRVDGRAEGIEVGDAVLVLDDHLAIDQGGLAGQLAAGIDHPLIGPRPVIAVAGEGADLAAIDDDQGAIAVILDLVNPALPGRRLRDEGREFRLDEAEGF